MILSLKLKGRTCAKRIKVRIAMRFQLACVNSNWLVVIFWSSLLRFTVWVLIFRESYTDQGAMFTRCLEKGQLVSCSTRSILGLTVYFMWLWGQSKRQWMTDFISVQKNNTVKKMKLTAIGNSKFFLEVE